MKFELEITKEKVEELKTFFKDNLDCDDLTTTEMIQELFLIGNRHGGECDLREDVTITEIKRKEVL